MTSLSSEAASQAAESVFYMARYPGYFANFAELPWIFSYRVEHLRAANSAIRTHLRGGKPLAVKPLISFTRSAIVVGSVKDPITKVLP